METVKITTNKEAREFIKTQKLDATSRPTAFFSLASDVLLAFIDEADELEHEPTVIDRFLTIFKTHDNFQIVGARISGFQALMEAGEVDVPSFPDAAAESGEGNCVFLSSVLFEIFKQEEPDADQASRSVAYTKTKRALGDIHVVTTTAEIWDGN